MVNRVDPHVLARSHSSIARGARLSNLRMNSSASRMRSAGSSPRSPLAAIKIPEHAQAVGECAQYPLLHRHRARFAQLRFSVGRF